MTAGRRIRRIEATTPDRGRGTRKPPSTAVPATAPQNPNAAGARTRWAPARPIRPASANARADATTKAAPAAADLCMVMPPVAPLPARSEGQVHRGDTHDSGEPVL